MQKKTDRRKRLFVFYFFILIVFLSPITLSVLVFNHLGYDQKNENNVLLPFTYYGIIMTSAVFSFLPLCFLKSFKVFPERSLGLEPPKLKAEAKLIVPTIALSFAQATAVGCLYLVKSSILLSWLASIFVFILSLSALTIVTILLTPDHVKLFIIIRRTVARILEFLFRLPSSEPLSKTVARLCIKLQKRQKFLERFAFGFPIFTLLLLGGLTFLYSSNGIIDAYNPNTKELYFKIEDSSPADAYTYLLDLKEEFQIGNKEKKAAVIPFRLAEKKRKAIVVVLDDFKPELVVTGKFGFIPAATITSHGEIVSTLIEHYAKKLKNLKVKIVKVDLRKLKKWWKREKRYKQEPLSLATAFKEALLKAGAVDRNLKPKALVFLNYSMGSRYYDLDDFDVLNVKLLKELNNNGILIYTAAGNRKDHRIKSLDITKAIAFLLPNYTVVGAPQFQPGEINLNPEAKVVSTKGTVGAVWGTSFSTPTALSKALEFADKLLGAGQQPAR